MTQLHLTSPSKVLSNKTVSAKPGASKTSWLAMAAGALTTVFAAIGAANTLIPQVSNISATVLDTLNIPACLSYADQFGGTQSSFRKEGKIWREYPRGSETFSYEFKEIRRTRQEIMLWNVTPRANVPDAASLVVHLPVCGGTAVLTEGLPERRTNLEEVWPDRS
ncbi:hypothetical protein; putative signal peptide [Bradyrhizobium sp. ORS 278]|uniref:hypothetical protein n=1 Tax=Bradyrhizobium sp. (strain ORS 278) TaxID=114615 RepID=UPI0001508F3B|nr:hypothetical protein [Bradyrhizobium sp. ORS 278]CAL77083.1 hypothetical protein; putative signal peptide [Bradyrhizobium sp. ORS 278]